MGFNSGFKGLNVKFRCQKVKRRALYFPFKQPGRIYETKESRAEPLLLKEGTWCLEDLST